MKKINAKTNAKNNKTSSNKTDKTVKDAKLTDQEEKSLKSAITKMRNALKSFLTIGHEHKKNVAAIIKKFGTVGTFAGDVLGVSESYYYRQVRATEVYDALDKAGRTVLPHAESMCRPVTLNVLAELIGEVNPKEVSGKTPEKVLYEIWDIAGDAKAKKLGKDALPKGTKFTAAEVTAAKAAWKAKHMGSGSGTPGDNKDPKQVKPGKPGEPEKKDLVNDQPELPNGLPVETEGAYQVPAKGAAKGPDSKVGTDTKDLTREELISKVAEQRTELAKLRKENAALALAARNNKADWQTAPLFKEIFEAGKKVVAAKCLESNDADKVSALADLEKIIFG